MIEMIMMLVAFVVLAAKKKKDRVPRWIQLTIDGTGGVKGGCGWLTSGLKIQPLTLESGTGRDFEKDGYTMPDFKDDIADKSCFIIYGRDELALPLLIHQKYAVMGVAKWLCDRMKAGDSEGVTDYRGPIDIFHLAADKVMWSLKFTRGKKEFDPYRVEATVHTLGKGRL